jgi:uracil-DNA glycosylase
VPSSTHTTRHRCLAGPGLWPHAAQFLVADVGVRVTPRPIHGPAVLTLGSSLGSYIVPTDQHESFVRTLSSLMRTRENFPVGHPSQIAPSQARLTWRFFRDRLPKKKMHLVDMITLLILLSLRSGHPIRGARISQSTPLEDRRPRRSTPIQEPPLLATSVCLVSSYAMPCDHSGPTCAMRHIPEPPSPHTPVKPRGSALIPLVTPRPIHGPAVLTLGSSLGSYIVPTDQHESFVRTLSSLMRTRENFPVGHPSQIAPSQARLTWRFFRDRLPKKKMHLVDMITLLILLSLRSGHPIPGARISQYGCRSTSPRG